ncbi:unnamed protein product [Prunus brigantina]
MDPDTKSEIHLSYQPSAMDMVQVQCNKGGSSAVTAKAHAKRSWHGFSQKCAALVKEQRARIYILRRCATMLLCWYIQGDD